MTQFIIVLLEYEKEITIFLLKSVKCEQDIQQ